MAVDELWTQVRVSFAEDLVDVVHLRPGQSFSVGESPDADLTHALPGVHRLVMATASGAVIACPMRGGLESVSVDQPARLALGNLVIEITCEPALSPVLSRRPADHGWWLSMLGSALVLVPFLVLSLIAADARLPPLETDSTLALIYTARSSAKVEEPVNTRRPPPPEPQRARPDRARPSGPAAPAPRNLAETETEADSNDDEGWAPGDGLRLVRARGKQGPQPVATMLQRISSPVEDARKRGMLGVMPSEEEIGDFVAVSATAFGAEVDDRELWAAMTDGPLDTTIGGLELVGSGRSGGVASEVIRSGAPDRPRPDLPVLDHSASLRVSLLATHIQGGLDHDQAQRFARAKSHAWENCVDPDEMPVTFEIRYRVGPDGRVGGVEIPRAQLSAKTRRCIIASVQGSAGPDVSGGVAKVEQRVSIGRGHFGPKNSRR